MEKNHPCICAGDAVSARVHVKLGTDFVRSFKFTRFVPVYIPASRLLAAMRLYVMLSTPMAFKVVLMMAIMAPVQAIEHETALPPLDSFSYLKDPLFSPFIGHGVDALGLNNRGSLSSEPEKTSVAGTPPPALECPATDVAPQSAGVDEFETRLAIDKALSQILKLTVDYGALRNRVSNLCQPAKEEDQSWFAFGQKGTQGEKQLEALQQINQKQIADRDKQLTILQTRLEATQKRYDNENVARLLAEKRLKVARDGVKKNNSVVSKTNEKLQTLAEQLEQNQAVIRQLKIDLTDEKLKAHRLSNEAVAVSESQIKTEAQNTAALASLPVDSTSDLSQIQPASEWTIGGLEFERGSAEIKLESAVNLDMLVDYLTKNKKLHIQVNGYTDSIGSASSNLKLSQNRAQAVADYLQQRGVDQYQLNVLGYGERRPVADNETEAGRVSNRRVAVLFLN